MYRCGRRCVWYEREARHIFSTSPARQLASDRRSISPSLVLEREALSRRSVLCEGACEQTEVGISRSSGVQEFVRIEAGEVVFTDCRSIEALRTEYAERSRASSPAAAAVDRVIEGGARSGARAPWRRAVGIRAPMR